MVERGLDWELEDLEALKVLAKLYGLQGGLEGGFHYRWKVA
jgi:hypothetical protein